MPNVSAYAHRRAPAWGGFCVADWTHATAAAMTLVYREQPVIGIVAGTDYKPPHQESRDGETKYR